MNNNVQNAEIEYTREDAKLQYKNKNYPLAKTMFETLWNKSNKSDVFLLYDYGQALRKVNESKIFVEICRDLNENQNIMSNNWIISTLCWCLYDCYIKNYSVSDDDEFSDFIKRAEYIKNHCVQMNANEHQKNPYVLTIIKVVKSYNERTSKNFKEIIKWLSYVDPDRLSEIVFKFQDGQGKDREQASPKEFYYQHMAKAFEKREDYENCIIICEKAFQQIEKFHYRNFTWLKARMYYSKCMLQDDIEESLKKYKELASKENVWFMYHKLSQICFRYNKVTEALFYVSKALICRFEDEKMVNLLLDAGLLWQASGNIANAKLFFQACAFYRYRQGWSFSEELQYSISIFEIDIEMKPNIRNLQRISKDYIETIEGKNDRIEGQIDNILSHGCAGFIKPNCGGLNVYFNMKDVIGKKTLTKGDIVEYELFTNKEDSKTRAVKIMVRG